MIDTGTVNVGIKAGSKDVALPVTDELAEVYPVREVVTVIVADAPADRPEIVSGRFVPDAVPFFNVPAVVFKV